MSGRERNDDLESLLQRHAALRPLSQLEELEPPPELDRIVIEQARRAIESEEPAPMYRPSRWALPFALAATLVLAFAVVVSMDPPGREPAPPVAAGGAEAAYAPRSAKPGSARDADSRAQSPRPQAETPPSQEAEIVGVTELSDRHVPTVVERKQGEALDDDAQAWLARIEALHAEGRTAEAEREWQAFRDAHPGLARRLDRSAPTREPSAAGATPRED